MDRLKVSVSGPLAPRQAWRLLKALLGLHRAVRRYGFEAVTDELERRGPEHGVTVRRIR